MLNFEFPIDVHYLGYVLLCYILIYYLEVSFHFNSTLLQLNVIKSLLYSKKSSWWLETPNGSSFFQFPSVKVGVIRSWLYTWKTDLKLDSLSFPTATTKLHWHSPF